MTHGQSLSVRIRLAVPFGTELVLASAEKPLTFSTSWDTGAELYLRTSERLPPCLLLLGE